MRSGMRKKIVLWVLTLSVAVGIFAFSEQSAEQSSAISGAITQGLLGGLFSLFEFSEAQQEIAHEMIRSMAHIFSFTLLGLFASLLSQSYHLKYWLPITVAPCAAYAVLDECHQLWAAAGRAFEWIDVAKDCLGVLLGTGLAIAICRGAARYRAKKQKEGN